MEAVIEDKGVRQGTHMPAFQTHQILSERRKKG